MSIADDCCSGSGKGSTSGSTAPFSTTGELPVTLIGELQTAKEAESIERNNTAQHLQRRNGNKLNAMVQSRHNPEAWATDGGVDTDVDLLVDRLHDLAEHPMDQH